MKLIGNKEKGFRLMSSFASDDEIKKAEEELGIIEPEEEKEPEGKKKGKGDK